MLRSISRVPAAAARHIGRSAAPSRAAGAVAGNHAASGVWASGARDLSTVGASGAVAQAGGVESAAHRAVPQRHVGALGAQQRSRGWRHRTSFAHAAVAAAAAGAAAVAMAASNGASCEAGLSPLEEAVAAGGAKPMSGVSAELVETSDLLSDAIEAEALDETREVYKKAMKTPLLLVSGTAHQKLAADIASELYEVLVEARVGRFADGEVSVELDESVRGCDVYVLQPTCAPVNDNIMELLLLIR